MYDSRVLSNDPIYNEDNVLGFHPLFYHLPTGFILHSRFCLSSLLFSMRSDSSEGLETMYTYQQNPDKYKHQA